MKNFLIILISSLFLFSCKENKEKQTETKALNESIFEQSEEDEIILCLNYDGLYGINNINRFLQSCNNHPPIQWGVQIYKVGDPILFNESNRFAPLIYNNLKGRIVRIEKSEDVIQFDIEIIDVSINELDADDFDFDYITRYESGKIKTVCTHWCSNRPDKCIDYMA